MPGAILFNGNAETEAHLVHGAAPLLLASRHRDPEIAASRRVLLVTAGWSDAEHDEGHVKRAINEIGLPSRYEGGHDTTLVNLSLLHELRGFTRAAPHLAEAWLELRRVVETARSFYLEHNAHTLRLFRRTLAEAKSDDPALTVARLVTGGPDGPDGTGRRLLRHALSREIRHGFEMLSANDEHLIDLLREIEQRAFDDAGLVYDPDWRAARERLERRILTASTMIFCGGRLDLLLDALRFFRLRDALAEALRRGAQIVATSAGAMVFSERVIIYDDHAARDFQLYDRGLSIVPDIQLFPHCMERIQTDDPDNLAYLARRFRHHVCVGLNQRSFLLFELEPRRATSVGADDGVYVFDPEGRKLCYPRGEAIPI